MAVCWNKIRLTVYWLYIQLLQKICQRRKYCILYIRYLMLDSFEEKFLSIFFYKIAPRHVRLTLSPWGTNGDPHNFADTLKLSILYT